MYGLIGNFTAQPGQRNELISLMTASVSALPGCLSYVVAKDPNDADKIWITEVWDSADSHKASLHIPAVAETIKKAMPLIAGFGDHIVTEPVGGFGI
ncbi:putative quinol monooxygenase [Asticcacaulis sp. YBE204]|uniref:putative quinol monooxygenase n=1 Tax=Asticcacaulis sp. YBE204 TaxID=1282363 RepID=UPI0003C3F5A3|nr:putative quinol monooxygenase [Asticcacaulis sp. YBE204]ESQ79800.1 antibiotic biosynthesis monooxygenase [Asticcacaulis sp. YBE204]